MENRALSSTAERPLLSSIQNGAVWYRNRNNGTRRIASGVWLLCSLGTTHAVESVLEFCQHVNVFRTPMSQQMAGMLVKSASSSTRCTCPADCFQGVDELDGLVSQLARSRSTYPVDALL